MSTAWSDWSTLCRPSPSEDHRRDLIGAWHRPSLRRVRRRSASAMVSMKGRWGMIVIGADTHKLSHALAAVDGGIGALVGECAIGADDAGHLTALRWARELDEERVWAIEDCRHVSRRFEQALIAAGERVIRVPPHLMGASRRGEREPGKSDRIDALAVARAVLREGIERFPVAFLDEQAMQIRLLGDHRDDLVAERTRAQNRLRWHLVELRPKLEASLPKRSLDRQCQL